MKNLKVFRMCLVVGLMFAGLDLQAQTKNRVRFAKGKSSATVSSRIAKNQTRCFVLSAKSGQSVDAKLNSPTKRVVFFEFTGMLAVNNEFNLSQGTDDGDNEICVRNDGKATTFKLSISIH